MVRKFLFVQVDKVVLLNLLVYHIKYSKYYWFTGNLRGRSKLSRRAVLSKPAKRLPLRGTSPKRQKPKGTTYEKSNSAMFTAMMASISRTQTHSARNITRGRFARRALWMPDSERKLSASTKNTRGEPKRKKKIRTQKTAPKQARHKHTCTHKHHAKTRTHARERTNELTTKAQTKEKREIIRIKCYC